MRLCCSHSVTQTGTNLFCSCVSTVRITQRAGTTDKQENTKERETQEEGQRQEDNKNKGKGKEREKQKEIESRDQREREKCSSLGE